MPPSNYNYIDKPKDGYGGMLEKFEHLFFRFNNQYVLPRNIIDYCNKLTNDKYISIENLFELDENKLVDKKFIKIIDKISNETALNNDTWRQFGRICAILKYSLEYFNYFSKNENYGGEDNIDEYNKIYEKAIKDLNTKDKKIEDEIRISKAILRDWIKEENYNFFDHIESQIIDFENDIMADNIFNQVNKKCIYNNDEWYCYNKSTGSWKHSKRLLYLKIKDNAKDYSIYIYLIKPIHKFKSLSSRAFKTDVINELSDVLYYKKLNLIQIHFY